MFGYIADNEIRDEEYAAPVFIGEFAGTNQESNYWKYLL